MLGSSLSLAPGLVARAEPSDMLWPIPETEIAVNPDLAQNPGY
jgi:hypothetical protein